MELEPVGCSIQVCAGLFEEEEGGKDRGRALSVQVQPHSEAALQGVEISKSSPSRFPYSCVCQRKKVKRSFKQLLGLICSF